MSSRHDPEDLGVVSIIIPTFNRVKLLIKTLESVLKQNYKYWECILIDDGSSEENVSEIRAFIEKDNRLKFLERKYFGLPKGANSCRNIGIEEASGDYIIFFDSDDLFLPNALQERVEYFTKNPDNDFVVFQVESFFEDKNSATALFTKEKENYLHSFLSHDIPWTIMAPMLKTTFVKKSERFDLAMPRLQDPDFYTTLLLQKDIKFMVLHNRNPDMLYRANDAKPKLTNVLTGFLLYVHKFSKLNAELINPIILRNLLKECYLLAYKHFRWSDNKTVADKKLMFKLTITAYRENLITKKEFLSQLGKLIYFSVR